MSTGLYCWIVSCSVTSLCLFSTLVFAAGNITRALPLADGRTVVSPGGIFELGFFSSNRKNRYLGIWYKKVSITTVVWVANRDNPITESPGVLKINDDGRLVLLDRAQKLVWSSNNSHSAIDPVARLLDSGNLVLREANDADPQNHKWQSFDFPTDTLLPGMKLGWDFEKSLNRYLTAWKNWDDPSSGEIKFKLDYHGFPEIYMWKDDEILYRSGPWNGLRFSGVPEMKPMYVSINFIFTQSRDEVCYSYELVNRTMVSRLVANSSGTLQRLTWIEKTQEWVMFWYAPKDQCDHYRECGPYGICNNNASPVCECAEGFRPNNLEMWNLRDGSGGCGRKTKLDCGTDGFLTLNDVKLPETSRAFVNCSMSLDECAAMCRKNCSCTAYANSDVFAGGGGIGCVIWTGDLFDLRQYADGGQDLYVRMAASDLGGSIGRKDGSNNSNAYFKVVAIAVGAGVLLLGLCFCLVWRKTMHILRQGRRDHRGSMERSQDFLLNEGVVSIKRDHCNESRSRSHELELPMFDFSTIVMATDNFSVKNKLGQGGFGSVYKGMLVDDQEIAVKRLSKTSGQGIDEFKNEVRLIARLQHRNLVRLLGCCIEMEEKMLIYEYMQNRSLDSILFDKEKSSQLDWPRRFNIICGIARGLLYLHQDSRFRIIHRDLKASNILLDGKMSPKISDFGMARIFGGDQTEANTKRIVGTYGYMSPEYAMDGIFSVKSDVFSFGVLVLEIVSGKKKRGFHYSSNQLNLLGHAWKLWHEGKGFEFIDSSLGDSYTSFEALKCIQVGLLCVQDRADDRPTMSSVVLMLCSESAALPQPKNPGFCLGRNPSVGDSFLSKQEESCTVNEVTVTMLDAR